MEILIPILMFLIPVAAAILDKKNRKNKARPEVLAEPIFFPEIEKKELRERPQVQGRASAAKPKAPVREKNVALNKEAAPATETVEERMDIDPKKLIIYSEILKPKFDE